MRHLEPFLDHGGAAAGAWRQIATHVIVPMCFKDADEAVGHPYIIMHLSDRLRFTSRTMDRAAAGGHLDVVRWLHENRTEGCTTRAMDRAVDYGYLDVVRWLSSNRAEDCSTWARNWAAQAGYLDVV